MLCPDGKTKAYKSTDRRVCEQDIAVCLCSGGVLTLICITQHAYRLSSHDEVVDSV